MADAPQLVEGTESFPISHAHFQPSTPHSDLELPEIIISANSHDLFLVMMQKLLSECWVLRSLAYKLVVLV